MFKLFLVSLMLIRAANLSDVTYYEILEISKTASSQEIRHAYKKLAVKYHPDKNSNEKEQEKFIKITEAYEMLKDPEKRRKYDLYGTFSSYTRKYDYRSQAEYNNLYYNGLYYNDPYVDTVTGAGFYNYLTEGFHFINFYSPFCPPCQNLADHWKKLAELYKGIMKVGAVNCKYHNSFCYNSMRIGSYPSLLFYPNAKHGNFIYYHGEQNLEALDAFVMKYLRSQVHVPTVAQLRSDEKPMAYVLGSNRIDKNILTRISYHLKDLVTVVIVEDDDLRAKLTDDEYTTVVFKYKDIKKEISSTEEKNILKEIVEALPKIEAVTPEKLKDIRNQLRNGYDKPWVLYFSTPGQNKLLLHQMTISYPHMHFGEVDCSKWSQLCLSLQVEEYPAWALLKRGGGYQLAPNFVDIRSFLNTATAAVNLHSLSASELSRIVGGDVGVWVLVVIPYQLSWDHVYEPFLQASLHFIDSQDISFGIASCSSSSDEYCKRIVSSQPAVLLQDRSRRHYYRDRIDQHRLIEFIELIKNSNDLELTEQQLLEIMDPSNREESWLVSFLPSNCGPHCDGLMHELRLVAKKLRPLQFVRTGVLRCATGAVGLCRNVRAPTARLYPLASGQHYTVSLQHLTEAPYILEWALEHIDDSVQKLNWHSFSKNVIAEDLNPTSGKKPWLVYFHSPRCYRCYEMYADFAIAGILLNNAVNLGKVNCITERSLCQHEQITSYPSLRLYLNRNNQQTFSSVISIPVKDYSTLLLFIKPHLTRYDEGLLAGVDFEVKSQGFGVKHDEL